MKELSSIDLHHLIKELQFLVDGKIDQIHQPEKEELNLIVNGMKNTVKIIKELRKETEDWQGEEEIIIT